MADLAAIFARHIVATDPQSRIETDPIWPTMAAAVLADALRGLGLHGDAEALETAVVAANPRIMGYEATLAGAKMAACHAVRALA